MPWTKDSALRYDQWAQSLKGRFALEQEERLLQGMISSWPRRKQRLLDVGCGTGLFLDFFWSCGFDLTGIDKSPDMLARAREKMDSRVDLHVGVAEHLPFDDREFDYVTIMTVLEFVDDPAAVLLEAARVARKGILITFLNRCSLYGWSVRMGKKKSSLSRAHWFSWCELRGLIQKSIGHGSVAASSILLGPPSTWTKTPPFRQMNSLPVSPYLGAVTAVRIDLNAPRAQTPLMAWNTEPTM